MHAAVVRSFSRPPRYEELEPPRGELVVDVLAAGLHPRVRSGADGSHYTSEGELPLIPGIDGVGRTPAGELVYFVLPDTTRGSMAERTAIDRRRCVPLPADADPVAVAAAMNPAMSSWIALRRRIRLQPGARVLVLGAKGNAGSMAVEIARFLGAGDVVAVGRDPEALDPDVDVVLDYLWGEPAAHAIRAIVTARADRSRPLDWIQIGSVAGPDLELPSAALRAADLRLLGSGQGSVATEAIVAELPALAAEISAGTFTVNASPVPLSEVEATWSAPRNGRRVVFTP